ncbi:hypothetical protein Tco_0606257 [Tanacetum coccineum]
MPNQSRIKEPPRDYRELGEAFLVSREDPTYQIHFSYYKYKTKHEFVYKPPSVRNKNDKGDVKAIDEDEIKPFETMPNPSPIISNSPTVSPFLKECAVHIPYTNANTFAEDVMPNHVGDKELNSIEGFGNRVLTKKDDMGMPKENNKEWKLNEKAVPHNKEVYHYLWHPTEIPHLNRIIKES